MSVIGALSHAIRPLGITATVPGREATAREFPEQLRDALLGNPDRFAQLGEAIQMTLQTLFPSMPPVVARDGALAHIRLALTRAGLPELPASLVRPRVIPPGRPETRAERRTRILGAAAAMVDQARTETAAARYARQAAKWYGVGDSKPRVTIK
jgi:hypothetical protein